MFWCLPDDSKCEWRKLESFVKQYNRIFKANYTLAECLDVFDNKSPQPEIRLKAENEKDIVIEHKIITWPRNYLQLHRAQHEFTNFFIEKILSEFQDDIYVLEINSDDIVPRKRTIQKWANSIVRIVLKNKDRIQRVGRIYSSDPIKWVFRRLPDVERDEDVPKKGVGVHINDAIKSPSVENFELESNEIKDDVKGTLVSHLKKSSVKFKDYKDSTRIFITELHGEHLLLGHELIKELLPSIDLPSNIDQIWVGYPEWISENDYETAYKQLYG